MRIRRVLALVVVLAPVATLSSLYGCEYVTNVGYYSLGGDGGPDGNVCPDGGACASPAIVEVASGVEGACAVLDDGSLWCWGGNQYGSVGVGPEGDDACVFNGMAVACRYQAVKVPGVHDVVHVAGGLQFTCAIERDASVWCWGRNDKGLLGHEPGTLGDHTCASTLDGGEPSSVCNEVPHKVEGVSAVEIATGVYHSCALDGDGGVSCWGNNQYGGLGTRDIPDASATPHTISGIPRMSHIAIGLSAHSCAIAANDGEVWCWGPNDYGELGHPTSLDHDLNGTASFVPLPVVTTDEHDASTPLTGVTSVKPAYIYTCALTSGDVLCWGSNDFGTLGSSFTSDSGVSFSPAQVTRLGVASSIDARFEQACALVDDGGVSCWGSNVVGELGMGSIETGERCRSSANTPCRTTPVTIPTLSDISAIAVGSGTAFALSKDHHTLWAWGDNDTARLGHPPRTTGDLTLCGDFTHSVCNAAPRLVPGLP